MSLDFTALDNLKKQTAIFDFSEPFADEEGSYTNGTEKPATGQNTPAHTHQLDKALLEREKVREVYQSYQENIHRAGSLRSEILKGIKRGEDPVKTLLKAVECISLMTGDTVIYTQAREDIRTIYGWGLGDPGALQEELEAVQERLDKLTRAKVPPGQEIRLQGAIQAHKDLVQDLERAIEKSGA